MNKQERLLKMVEQDLDARGLSTLFGIIGLFLFLVVSVINGVTVTTVALSFLVTQLPMLYQAWRRMKLLRTFNEDEKYQRLVRREFHIIVAMFLCHLVYSPSSRGSYWIRCKSYSVSH